MKFKPATEQKGSGLDKVLRIMGESKYTLGNAATDNNQTPEEFQQQASPTEKKNVPNKPIISNKIPIN